MANDEQHARLTEGTRMLLDLVAFHRVSISEYCLELSRSEFDQRCATWSQVTVAKILRELTNYEFNWADYVDRHPGTVSQGAQPPRESASGADVFDTWQAACERSRLAAKHLESLCSRGEFPEDRFRMALLPLGAAYARYTAQLQLLRTEPQ
ncbi:hypothetical protein ABZ499_17000 [Streptomyces sp. NPDC019990]|uniref:hypothetical protein n=1 Tax=Streptomyces sp. NPDC019990 TaxID=3154693 RepID=UPI003411B332